MPALPKSDPLQSQTTLLQLHSNVARILNMEQEAECRRAQAREALVHAGKMAAIGRMVAGVNHEIKRPLASMRLITENSKKLLENGDAHSVAENLQMLTRIMGQLDQLTRQLEGFSRRTPMRRDRVLLREVVSNAAAILAPQLQSGGGKIIAELGDAVATADADRLMLVLVNLIGNALDAVADSPDKRVEIDAKYCGGDIVLCVRDHGPGLSDDTLAHIFEPFFTTKPPGKGLGLGLALSVEVINEMCGKLSADNAPDGGARFFVRLPLAQ
jgi:two-component system C4-dicarboxylate transport sensor histidine kinase DctB